jgi:hypothetical protein
MSESITITVALPPKACDPNARLHWAAKSRGVRACRNAACLAAKAALKGQPGPMWEKASVKVEAFFPTARFPDPDNLIARLKATFDGVADAGVVANDRGLWPERPSIAKDKANPRIVLTITPEP